MEGILDGVCNTITTDLQRSHQRRRKYPYNIKTQYNIDGIIRHKVIGPVSKHGLRICQHQDPHTTPP